MSSGGPRGGCAADPYRGSPNKSRGTSADLRVRLPVRQRATGARAKPVLDYVDIEGDPNLPGHEECIIRDARGGHRILFIEVPEAKTVKNRVHFDLRPREGSRDDEVARLCEHGATVVADLRGTHGPGSGWVVFADPEGNEFCVLRSEAEQAASR